MVPRLSPLDNRSVSPVTGVALLLSITVILTAIVSASIFGVRTNVNERTPTAARSTGTFETGPSVGCGENTVRITHEGGDVVPAEEISVVVRLPAADATARLVDLPVMGTAFASGNTVDPDNIIYDNCVEGVIATGGKSWAAGRTIAFQLNAGGGTVDPGDSVEVLIVHDPSNGVVADVTLTAGR
ncbi:MAG: type IV pilin [Haloarcula sp.]